MLASANDSACYCGVGFRERQGESSFGGRKLRGREGRKECAGRGEREAREKGVGEVGGEREHEQREREAQMPH